MSVDGPGILASDLGHDVYYEIMNLYDAGTAIDEIRKRLQEFEGGLQDDMDKEIYLAASAKAFWEIGALDKSQSANLAQLVDSGVSLALWQVAGGATLFNARKAALHRLLRQIAAPRKVPRSPKKSRTIKNKLFALGDCLKWSTDDKYYRNVVTRISEANGYYGYDVLLMGPDTGSTSDEYAASHYYGRLIQSYQGPILGPHVIFLAHRDLVRDGNPFEIVGRVNLDLSRFGAGTFGVMRAVSTLAQDLDRIRGAPGKPGLFGDVLLPLRDLLVDPPSAPATGAPLPARGAG